MSLTFRGFGERDAREGSLCRANLAVVAKNAGPVSGLFKPFPGGIWRCRQRPVRPPTETGSSLATSTYFDSGPAHCGEGARPLLRLTTEQKALYDAMRKGIASNFNAFKVEREDGALMGPWGWALGKQFGI